MDQPPIISADFIDRGNHYPDLIEILRKAFASSSVTIPDRLHYSFGATEGGEEATLLLMPAWQDGRDLGVKLVTINPQNREVDLPSVQGTYLLMDAATGQTRAILDGVALTRKRTAATSALAATFLSRPDAGSFLMIGTGELAPELIEAHASVRPLQEVWVWGRNRNHAKKIEERFRGSKLQVKTIENIQEKITDADIISCATLSPSPLIFGDYLRPGQHIDLVGSYRKDMRESDDRTIEKADIFVDTYQGALSESGDLFQPLRDGIISREDVLAELKELCSGKKTGRKTSQSITLFKSVGYALEDLVAARYFYQLFLDHDGLPNASEQQ